MFVMAVSKYVSWLFLTIHKLHLAISEVQVGVCDMTVILTLPGYTSRLAKQRCCVTVRESVQPRLLELFYEPAAAPVTAAPPAAC